jgi:hypothetical protein
MRKAIAAILAISILALAPPCYGMSGHVDRDFMAKHHSRYQPVGVLKYGDGIWGHDARWRDGQYIVYQYSDDSMYVLWRERAEDPWWYEYVAPQYADSYTNNLQNYWYGYVNGQLTYNGAYAVLHPHDRKLTPNACDLWG